MKLIIIFILTFTHLIALSQTSPTRNWVESDIKYLDANGNSVMFTNSYPKGGGGYKYYNGKKYTYVVFWTRVQNTSLKPLALHIQFPTDSIAYFKTTESHIRILLPTAPMSPEKIQLYDYGLNNLQSIVSNKNLQQKMLQKTIDAKEDFFFYVSVLFSEVNGSARASFVLKGQDLFYKFSAGADSTIIPCGRIVFKH